MRGMLRPRPLLLLIAGYVLSGVTIHMNWTILAMPLLLVILASVPTIDDLSRLFSGRSR